MAFDWREKGFSAPPQRQVSPAGGLLLYRAWGHPATELGTGYFSLDKPVSVLDAELRFNIADWGNTIHFVSSFRLKEGFPYFVGALAHGVWDLSRAATQVYLESPFRGHVERLGPPELLKHDVAVAPGGRA